MTYFSNYDAGECAPRSIGFVCFDGIAAIDLTGSLEAFTSVRKHSERREAPFYETRLIGVGGRNFKAASGATFRADYTLETAPVFDTIIIPGGDALHDSVASGQIADWLRSCSTSTRRIASVAGGIYPFAQSGLLDGRCATTHWRLARDVARRFPRITINEAGWFIEDGGFYTSCGGAAGIEMCLAMVADDFGSKVALSIARELLVSLRPSGSEAPQVRIGFEQALAEERLAELPAWIIGRLQENLSIEVLSGRTGLCPRHFSRIFKRTFKSTPAGYVEQLRVNEAARHLVTRRLSIEGVADAVGFKNIKALRRAFERRFGMSPREFQKSFRPSGSVPFPRWPGLIERTVVGNS